MQDGYVVFDDPYDPIALGAGALDLERGFAGARPELLFTCGAVALGPIRWQPEINPYPAAALDIHVMSRAVRNLLFAGQLAEFLGLLFDAPALLTHSRGMLRDAVQPVQRDAAGVGYTLARQWVAAVVLLEDIDPAAMYVFPASHRLPVPPGQAVEP
ncbi:MAG TPA: hypothetical protein VFN42_06310, partial [Acetobacteraceae bacterium]|nr:hypothetical protein [Acetobacteraceae bacterium]